MQTNSHFCHRYLHRFNAYNVPFPVNVTFHPPNAVNLASSRQTSPSPQSPPSRSLARIHHNGWSMRCHCAITDEHFGIVNLGFGPAFCQPINHCIFASIALHCCVSSSKDALSSMHKDREAQGKESQRNKINREKVSFRKINIY